MTMHQETRPAGPGTPPPASTPGTPPYPDDAEVRSRSVGEIVGDIQKDLSTLVRQEIELAKVETKQEVAKAGKAAGMLGGAAFAGYMVALLLSLALVAALSNVMDPGWAALIVAAVWAVVGAVLYLQGRQRMRTVSPVPRQTVETLKEDAQWLKNPTRSEMTST
jgi:uncharacterized membrane protein YqjE